MALVGGSETVQEKDEHKEVIGGIKADTVGNEERPGEDSGEKGKEERPGEVGGQKGNEVPTENQSVVKKKRGRKPKIKGSETPVKVESLSKRDHILTPASDRPAREKKSVERFIADTASKKTRDVVIQKGSGTALKDIPNVVYKLSKRSRADNTMKDLHSVLYGKRAKVPQMKNNILQFSGFVWDENKNNAKVKEKLEKFHKENLANLCEVLDLYVSKPTTKKEELVAKLIEFLEAPHIKTDTLLEETQQKLKRKGRKRAGSGTPGKAPGKSAEKRQKNDGESFEVEEMNKEVNKNEEGEKNNVHTGEDKFGEEPQKEINDEDSAKGKKDDANHISKRKSLKGSPKKGSKRILNEENTRREDETTGKQIPEKAVISSPNSTSKKSKRIKTEEYAEKDKGEAEDKLTLKKGPRGTSKHTDKQDKSVNSGKAVVTEEDSDRILGRKALKRPSKRIAKHQGNDFIDTENAVSVSLDTPSMDMKTSGKELNTSYEFEATRGKRQQKKQTAEMAEGKKRSRGKASLSYPTDEELCSAIREFLNEVDFETATLSDIVNRLGERFNQDFRERKAHMKSLIQEELTRIAEEDDEDDAEDAEENQDEGQ